MTVRLAAATSRRYSLRALALVGSALGSTLVIQPAVAQNQTITGPTPYQNTGTLTGGPTTVTATTSTGDINLDLNTVTAANPGSATAAPSGAAISATNSGTGNVIIKDVNANITGTGASNGIFASAQGGVINITQSGVVDATNAVNSRGVAAVSNNGTITINANEVDGGLRGIFTGSVASPSGTAGALASLTTINVATATANSSNNTPNAIIAQGYQVVLKSGTASLTSTVANGGAAIFVNTDVGGATVTAGTTTALGQGQAALQVFSDGAVNVTSGTIRTTQSSDALSIQTVGATSPLTINSTTVTTEGPSNARGIIVGGNSGGSNFSAPNGITYGSATITSGSVTTAGTNSYGIYVTPNAGGATTINSGNVTTTGTGSFGIYETAIGAGAITGASTINSTGILKTSGAGAAGIQVAAGPGAVTVGNTGTVTTSGANSYGINVVGSTGAVNILGGGTVNVSGLASRGIAATTTTGAITINAGTTNTTGAYDANSMTDGSVDAIFATASGAGAINITSANASTSGAIASAIFATSNGGSVTINSGVATTTVPVGGMPGVALGAIARTAGDATITAATTNSAGAGISASAAGGNAAVTAGNVTAAAGNAVAVTAGNGLASATVTGGASAAGNGAGGVTATGTTGVALNVNSASSTGATTSTTTTRNNVTTTTTRRADAVYASTTGGAINATVNNASATGPLGTNTTSGQTFTADGVRLLATNTGGAVTLKGTGTLSSQSGYGLYVNTINADVTAGTVNSAGVNLVALEVDLGAPTGTATSAKVATTAVNATGTGSRGIFVTGPTGSTATISGGAITTAGGNGIEISGGFGNTAITSTSITGATIGINALNVAGTLAINSGTIALPTTAVAANAFVAGISASGTGAITINSGTITGNAANAGYGINATGNTGGSVAITSGSISSFGRSAIVGQTNTGALSVTSTGTITTAAVGGSTGNNGIQLFSTSGPITVTSNNIAASGDQSLGILASAGAGGTAAVTVTSTGTLTTTGVNSGGIQATGAGAVTVNANDVRTTGTAVFASGAGAVGVTAGTTRTSGTALGLNGQSSGGFVTVKSTDLAAGGIGIFASGATGAAVTSATLTAATTTSFGILSQVSTPAQGSTIVPTGVSVNSTTLTSAGGGIRTSSLTASTAINSGSVTTSGTNLAAIYAAATTGSIALTSGTLNASGTSGNGISANTTTGNILINSTSAITTGSYLASTNNSPDAITAFTSASGTGTVTINSDTASATGDLASAIFGYGGGNVTITSGTATTAGNGVGGTIVAIGANSRLGDASVTATTTTATGTNSSAVSVTSAVGNATATLGTATAINGQGLSVNAAKVASVTAATVSGGGDGFAGVFAQGGTGVVLNIGSAASSGTATTTTAANGTTTTRRADAIFATATAGTIDATIGSAKATGAGADAVRLIANGTGGAVTARITGALSSTSGYGLFIDPPGANTVTVASGASISGATGVSLTGASNAITNAGSITGTAGPGIIASGATTLDNSGGIAGTGGVAVQLGATNDAVTLRTGSAVTGAIVGGGGTDTATLIGTSNAATTSQQAAAFTGFDRLTVQSGYWTASAANPTVLATSATINGGASLDIANGAAGLTLTAPSIVDNGTLVVRGSSASAGSTFGASVVTGSGNALLTGGLVTLDRDNSLQNTGVTTIDTGTTVLLTATQVGNFINNGMVQIGNGGTTGLFTGTLADNGAVVSNRSDSYTFTGALTGTGTFVKNGAGTVTFGTNYAFTGVTQLNGGGVKLSTVVAPTTKLDAEGTGTYDLSGVNQTIAQLSGASTGATINITNDALTVNQDTTTSFAGSITGNGSLTKTGTGSLNLTGTNTYTGTTTVNGGRLAVNGSITSPVTVNSGGTLGGNGTVGNTVIGSGGTFAPGNSIGTTNVAGNLTFQAGSNYQVEANAAGMADRVNASATITINGGTVQVLAAPGTYNPITQYTILTAAGGISGQFAGVTSSLAFLSPLLTYSTNAVTLGLYRNDINFASMAASPNGAAVAAAIASRGFGNALYNAVLVQTATGAPVAFNQLSGEIHATIPSVLIDSDRRVRDAVLDHNHGTLRPGLGLWLQSLGTTAHSRSQGALANFNTTRLGLVGGVDYGLGDFRIGLNGGYFSDRMRNPNVFSRAQIGTELIGGSIGWLPEGGRLSAQGGITHAWHHVDTTRTVTVTGLAGSYQSASTARTTQAFGEISFALIDGPVAVAPFARYAHVWERADGFNETGGLATLSVARERRSNDFGSAGVRLSGSRPIASGLAIEPNLSLGYLHSWGRLYSVRSETISGAAFSITGDRLARDNLDANGGVDLVVKGQLRLGVSGYLTRSSQWRDYGGKASVSFRF